MLNYFSRKIYIVIVHIPNNAFSGNRSVFSSIPLLENFSDGPCQKITRAREIRVTAK